MISKELLSKVFNRKVRTFTIVDNIVYYKYEDIYYGGISGIEDEEINIYELAHECKQLAVSKGYSLYSGYDKLINKYGVYVNLLLFGDDESTIGGWDTEIYFIANTESEAIFKAYQYIMENKCGS